VSATLATVVETATAKELGKRYASDAELIAELENVLALEASRAGTADGQVTAVLDTVAPEVRRRVPLAVRHRRALLTAVAAGIAAAVAVVVVLTLAAKPNRGEGSHRSQTALVAVRLCASCAYAYNPYGIGGTAQDNAQAPRAVDGDASTGWSTEEYYSGQLNKPGVGLYVTTPSSVAARRLVVITSTPGFSATVYGSASRPSATSFTASGWVKLASASDTGLKQTFALKPGGHGYRYYLVWITRLPPNADYATIDGIQVYR
jgi:serine/threonine-protein kinase